MFQSDFDSDDDLTVFGTTMEDDSDAARVSITKFTSTKHAHATADMIWYVLFDSCIKSYYWLLLYL